MASTLAEQLTAVQTAIAAVESGFQTSTDDDGNQITYPDLNTLYKREERLERKIARQSTGRIKVTEV